MWKVGKNITLGSVIWVVILTTMNSCESPNKGDRIEGEVTMDKYVFGDFLIELPFSLKEKEAGKILNGETNTLQEKLIYYNQGAGITVSCMNIASLQEAEVDQLKLMLSKEAQSREMSLSRYEKINCSKDGWFVLVEFNGNEGVALYQLYYSIDDHGMLVNLNIDTNDSSIEQVLPYLKGVVIN